MALRDYNFALSRVFSVIRDAHLDPWTRPLHVPAPNGGEYLLTHRAIANRLWRPQDFDLIPADELDVRGKFVVPRVTREGAGAALVAVRRRAGAADSAAICSAACLYRSYRGSSVYADASARSNLLTHLPRRPSVLQVTLCQRTPISLRQ